MAIIPAQVLPIPGEEARTHRGGSIVLGVVELATRYKEVVEARIA